MGQEAVPEDRRGSRAGVEAERGRVPLSLLPTGEGCPGHGCGLGSAECPLWMSHGVGGLVASEQGLQWGTQRQDPETPGEVGPGRLLGGSWSGGGVLEVARDTHLRGYMRRATSMPGQ